MKKNNYAVVLRVALGLAVWFAIYKCYAAFAEPLFADRLPEMAVLMLRSMVVPYTLGLGGCYHVIRGMERLPMPGGLKATPGLTLKAFIVQMGLSMPVIIIVNILCNMMGAGRVIMTADMLFGKNRLFYFVLLLIFNPIFEELLFRKISLDRLMVIGEVPAIIVSAVFFALPHIYSAGIPQFFGTFIIALVYAYLRVKTGRMWPVIVLHSLFNVYGCYFAIFMQSRVPTTGIFILLSILILPITAVILVVKHFKGNAVNNDYVYSKGVL